MKYFLNSYVEVSEQTKKCLKITLTK